MIHIKKFNELYAFNTRMPLSKDKSPYCSDMESRGYRINYLDPNGSERFAFDKNFEIDDDVYWLGEDTPEYKFGNKYVVDQNIINIKNTQPFYNLYCRCNPSPNKVEQEIIKKRKMEIIKNQEKSKRKLISRYKNKKK